MERVYYHYKEWEDYQNGMYDDSKKENESELVELGVIMLTDLDLFFDMCKSVIANWPISTKVNLTNKSHNRYAWIGQAACNYTYNVPEILTRISWAKLDYMQQYRANLVADKIVNHFEISYETKNIEIHYKMGK